MKTIKIQPIIRAPRVVRPGASYIVTVDLRHQIPPEHWPYDREEYPLTCLLETSSLFEHRPLGEPTLLLHRFGGSYGEVRFLLKALEKGEVSRPKLLFVDEAGLPSLSIELPDIRIESSKSVGKDEKLQAVQDGPPPEFQDGHVPDRPILDLGITIPTPPLPPGRLISEPVTPPYLTLASISAKEFLERLKSGRSETNPTDQTLRILDSGPRPLFDTDPQNIAATGWGVIFAPTLSIEVRSALQPLLDFRRMQATRYADFCYQEFEYRHGESASEFLLRHGARAGMAPDPNRGVPYYLLLVGHPSDLPYSFQLELDVSYAVGRICFEQTQDYRYYAESVVRAETKGTALPQKLTIFGANNKDDPSTNRMTEELSKPLAAAITDSAANWEVQKIIGSEARKERLELLLGGTETPSILFSACHGIAFPMDDYRQIERQGALVCQDWPGPESEEGVMRDHYYSAEDVPDNASLHGLIGFFFSAYSVGTPERDSFSIESLGEAPRIAPRAFSAKLPQRLLAHPNGGALAVIGHIDRTWATTFEGDGFDNFRNCLQRLIKGHTIGWAMEYFNQSHAALAAQLSQLWEAHHRLEDINAEQFHDLWIAVNDLRNFAVFGDPAVRISNGSASF